MRIGCIISEPRHKQRSFAFAIVKCRRPSRFGDVRQSRKRQRLADVFFTVSITLSLIGYVSSAAATRCVRDWGGTACCEERNTPFCGECSVGVQNCPQNAQFAFARSEISTEDRERLAEAAAVIKSLPAGTVVEVRGHTDSTGPSVFNRELSQRRADAVREELIRLGVPAEMLRARGYGESGSRSASYSVR